LSLWLNTQGDNLKEKGFNLVHSCWSFSPWSIGSIAPGSGEAEHHGRRAWSSKVAHLTVDRKQRGKRPTGRSQGYDTLQKHAISGLHPPTRPYFLILYHLTIMPSNYDSIHGLIHKWS
jgi:hypothetical protein